MMSDGVALTSTAHPVLPWYRRLWLRFRRPHLSLDSLETIEIGIREPNVLDSLLIQSMQDRANYYKRKAEKLVEDNEIEKEIQAKGLTAPRISLADIEAVIAWEFYANASELNACTTPVLGPAHKHVPNPEAVLSLVTICVLILKNGFKVVGDSAPVSAENFNEEVGRKTARQKAIDKVWMLEGYLLKERLHRDSINASSGGGDFGDS